MKWGGLQVLEVVHVGNSENTTLYPLNVVVVQQSGLCEGCGSIDGRCVNSQLPQFAHGRQSRWYFGDFIISQVSIITKSGLSAAFVVGNPQCPDLVTSNGIKRLHREGRESITPKITATQSISALLSKTTNMMITSSRRWCWNRSNHDPSLC